MEDLYKQRVQRLEERLDEVNSDRARLSAQLEAERQASAAHVTDLQQHLESEIKEVMRRQELVRFILSSAAPLPTTDATSRSMSQATHGLAVADLARQQSQVASRLHMLSSTNSVQVEQNGPVLSNQVASAKEQLECLTISDASHRELLSIPQKHRSLADEVRIRVHASLADLKQENESLRLAAQVCVRGMCAVPGRLAHPTALCPATAACQHFQAGEHDCDVAGRS